MTREPRLTSRTHRDIADAALWHESQEKGLGERFLTEVDAAIGIISRQPRAFPIVHRHLRKLRMQTFKYGVFYIVDEKQIVILGVIDLRRNPEQWKSRLEKSI